MKLSLMLVAVLTACVDVAASACDVPIRDSSYKDLECGDRDCWYGCVNSICWSQTECKYSYRAPDKEGKFPVGSASEGTCSKNKRHGCLLAGDGKKWVNMALAWAGGKATQGSTEHGSEAERAIDGNSDGDYTKKSCSHTGKSSWWKVELEQEVKIDHVIVYNRRDCCKERITGAKVYVVDKNGGKRQCGGEITAKETGQDSYKRSCQSAKGKSVLIQGGDDYLTLCEVKVMVDATEIEWVNMAMEGDATQVDTWGTPGYTPTLFHGVVPTGLANASLAIDGNTDSSFWKEVPYGTTTHTKVNSCSCTNTLSYPTWWKVELKADTVIDHVIVYNRKLAPVNSKIDGAKVYVETTSGKKMLCGDIKYISSDKVEDLRYKIACGAVTGRSVLIEGKAGGRLQLCEVKVMVDPTTLGPDRSLISENEVTYCEKHKDCEEAVKNGYCYSDSCTEDDIFWG